MNGKKFRHELKYLISHKDQALLRSRLAALMKRDANVDINGMYKVRSLYFDDYWNSSYVEKMAGVYDRRKYRIRIYNDSDSVIKLECKQKAGSYIHKVSANLTRRETDQILAGKYGFLERRTEQVCKEFYYAATSRVLRPCVLVDYEREPYIYPAGDVRVTFDSDVRSTPVFGNLFDPDLPSMQYVLEDGKLVLEVKYTEFLPNMIRELLSLSAAEVVAVSKYTFCYEKSSRYFALRDLNY